MNEKTKSILGAQEQPAKKLKLLEKQNSIFAKTNKLTEAMRKENFLKARALFVKGNLARKNMELAQKDGGKEKALANFMKAQDFYTEAIKLYPDSRIINNLTNLLIEAGYDIDARTMLDKNKKSLSPGIWFESNKALEQKGQ